MQGWSRRWSPTAGPPISERISRAGDSSEPAATTTRGARTVTEAPRPSGVQPFGLDAGGAPVLDEHRETRAWVEQLGSVALRVGEPGPVGALLAPGLVAEAHVGGALGRVLEVSVLRVIAEKLQPSASHPSCIRCWGPFRSLRVG